MLALLVSCYQNLRNTFVSGSNPKVIELSESESPSVHMEEVQKYDLKKSIHFW